MIMQDDWMRSGILISVIMLILSNSNLKIKISHPVAPADGTGVAIN